MIARRTVSRPCVKSYLWIPRRVTAVVAATPQYRPHCCLHTTVQYTAMNTTRPLKEKSNVVFIYYEYYPVHKYNNASYWTAEGTFVSRAFFGRFFPEPAYVVTMYTDDILPFFLGSLAMCTIYISGKNRVILQHTGWKLTTRQLGF